VIQDIGPRIVAVAMLIITSGAAEVAAVQRLREMARHHAITRPGTPMPIPAPPADYFPTTIEQVAREAQVILRARLSKTRSYLDSAGDRILTDYRILEPAIVAGHLSSTPSARPGTGPHPTLTVWGGEAVVEGVLVRASDGNREPIEEGKEYLLFLKGSEPLDAARYVVYYGGIFEISETTARPLLRSAETIFKGATDGTLTDLLTRIRAGRTSR
jgi:hypothetical protein